MDFGTQGVDESVDIRIKRARQAGLRTYRSVKLTSSMGSSSEGSCKLRDSTKPSSPCTSPSLLNSAEPRLSNTSGLFACPSLSIADDNGWDVPSVRSVAGVDSEGRVSVVSILVNDRVEVKYWPEPSSEGPGMSKLGL